jgi:hypothetical protein
MSILFKQELLEVAYVPKVELILGVFCKVTVGRQLDAGLIGSLLGQDRMN